MLLSSSFTHKIPEFSLLNFMPLVYNHSHFLAATVDFTTFPPWPS